MKGEGRGEGGGGWDIGNRGWERVGSGDVGLMGGRGH